MIDTSKVMRFMTNNFLETGTAGLSYTSIAANYDFEDCLDPRQRTKVFKFGGRFLIEAGENDKIYLDGNTYTVAADDYGSAADLVIAINDVIAGATIQYSESEKEFFLTGDPAVTINLSNVTDAIWETLGFTTGTDEIEVGMLVANMVRIHWPSEVIEIDFGYQAEIGFIGLVSDLAEEFKIPLGAEIRIQGNNVLSFVAPPLDQIIPVYTSGAFKFIDDISDSAWRYVRLTITCPTASDHPEIGYLYIGDYTKFPERNIGTGFELDYDDFTLLSRADDGQIYANDKTPMRVYSSLEVGLAQPATAAFLKNIYKAKQVSTPFFVALDPQSFLSDTADEHLALVRFSFPPKYKHIIRNLFELKFELREVV